MHFRGSENWFDCSVPRQLIVSLTVPVTCDILASLEMGGLTPDLAPDFQIHLTVVSPQAMDRPTEFRSLSMATIRPAAIAKVCHVWKIWRKPMEFQVFRTDLQEESIWWYFGESARKGWSSMNFHRKSAGSHQSQCPKFLDAMFLPSDGSFQDIY